MHSGFAHDIENMMHILHNAGLDLKYMDVRLEEFDNYSSQEYPKSSVLTYDIAEKWIHNYVANSKQQMDKRVRTMKHLGRYQRSIGKDAYIPEYRIKPDVAEEPYLFTDEQLKDFFVAADRLVPSPLAPNRELIFSVMFRVIYCCGLRSSEACNLRVDDVDMERGTLAIYNSKGHKDRLLYMDDDVTNLCLRYDSYYRNILPNRAYFFQPCVLKQHYYSNDVCAAFNKVLQKMGFHYDSEKKPTTHGLRHLFAVQNVKKCLIMGEDFNNWVEYLCRYMGHSEIGETMYYLHMTAQLFPVYKEKLEKLGEGIGVMYVEE